MIMKIHYLTNVIVGAIIDRPRILYIKSVRRQAKKHLFLCGKSEILRISAGDP